MAPVKIRDIRTITTAPEGINLVVVRVDTTEPGLYGLGDATLAYRTAAVESVVRDYLKPLLVGRDVSRIDDLWRLMQQNAYWRNGSIANNAISGIDMALWDIKGKMANMPLYDLLGGKCRDYVTVYRHANAYTKEEVAEKVEYWLSTGCNHVRCNLRALKTGGIELANRGEVYTKDRFMVDTVEMLRYIDQRFGTKVKKICDAHEHLDPIEAVNLAKKVEEFNMFFMEDLLSPEQGDWFRNIREQTSTPIAVGELYVNPVEWVPLIKDRLIDFIRVHLSMIGGLTPARKLAVLCESFGVRTAWHGPDDLSPVGHAAQVHLDFATPNFGIQEFLGYNEVTAEVFPGSPVYKNGALEINDRPGLGIEIDEKLAAKFPISVKPTYWTEARLYDGTLHTP